MLTFEERIAWIINKIKERETLNNIQMAKILGVDKNTIQLYCHAKSNIKGSALAVLVNYFKINGEWIISGKGEPFTGAREKFPEVCGPPGVTPNQVNKITSYVQTNTPGAGVNGTVAGYGNSDAMFASNQTVNIDEAMGKAYKVLNAGSSLSVALYMNIQQFALALDTGQALQLCQDEMKKLQEQINELNIKIDKLSAHPAISEGQGAGSELEKAG